MGGWVDLQKFQKGLCTCFRAHGLNPLGSMSLETHKKSVLAYCACTPTRSRPDASRKISCSPKCARYEAAHQRSNWLRWASCMSRRGSSFCALQVVSTLGVMSRRGSNGLLRLLIPPDLGKKIFGQRPTIYLVPRTFGGFVLVPQGEFEKSAFVVSPTKPTSNEERVRGLK